MDSIVKLSILIATIEERKKQFDVLLSNVLQQCSEFKGVEVVWQQFIRYDHAGGTTVGENRQWLIDNSRGRYVLFCDDDDELTADAIKKIHPYLNESVDVICPKVLSYIDGVKYIIDQSIYYESEQLHSNGDIKRFPSVYAVWNRECLNRSKFPALNNGEDFIFTKECNPKTEIKINDILSVYNFSSEKTIASKAIRRCIVTFSNTDRYNRLAERMKGSNIYGYDLLHFNSYQEIGCRSHEEYPYAFKPYSIQKAREMGYNSVLWLDSAIYLTKDPINVFKHFEEQGYLLFDNIGHSMGAWTHDQCINHYNIDRDESFNIKMVMACAMGFNFNNKQATSLFDHYLSAAHEDMFKGSWTNNNKECSKDLRVKGHRHDQSVISCLAHNMELKLTHPHSTFIAYKGNEGMTPHAETVCLISDGI